MHKDVIQPLYDGYKIEVKESVIFDFLSDSYDICIFPQQDRLEGSPIYYIMSIIMDARKVGMPIPVYEKHQYGYVSILCGKTDRNPHEYHMSLHKHAKIPAQCRDEHRLSIKKARMMVKLGII